jgi:PleD family two-component response regulator
MTNEKTILIIDDLETNINILIELLEDKYDLLASLSGEEALEIVEEERVDLILLDIMMPGLDGFEVCERLKSNEKTKDIPIIFITAKTDEESIEKAYEIGGVDYISKPFRAREVLSRINTHLSLSEQKHSLEDSLKTNITLLNQYKEVVDKGTIVSKTNKKGIITYVNDAFCKISGYSKEELIGKAHNIVRHKDTPASIYKVL